MKKLLITFLLLSTASLIYGQIYERNDRKYVFSDEANIREGASLNAKIRGTLKQGEEVIHCAKSTIPDTLNGIISSWIPVIYKGNAVYIWGNSLATNSFVHASGSRLLVKNDSKGLTYKILVRDSLIGAGSYKDRPYENYSYIHQIQPLFTIKNGLYFKLSDSDKTYLFDGKTVVEAGKSEKENVHALHQSSRDEIKDSLGSIINRDKVNLRSSPSIESKIIGQLPIYTLVEELEKLPKREEINKEENYWYKIKWKGKTGYVWGSSISSPMKHIHDNDDENTSYLLCNNALFVLYRHKIVAHAKLRFEVYDETLHSFGDLGFGYGYDFVAIEFIAHSCGETGGDLYYIWDGKEIKRFCFDYGIGDGGLSEVESYVFPSYPHGIPGTLIKNSYSTEIIEITTVDDCEEGYADAIDYKISSVLNYNGDTLIEVPSKHLNLKQLIQKDFPNFKLVQYEFGDINSDTIEDVVFQLRMDKFIKNSEGNYTNIYKSKIGIALGTGKGTLEVVKVNEHLVEEPEYPRLRIFLNGPNLSITTYSIWNNEYSDRIKYGRKIYNFVYNPADQKIYWESIRTIFENGSKKLSFKTKKVLFEDAWNFNQDEYGGDE